jgi:hypothetical protein
LLRHCPTNAVRADGGRRRNRRRFAPPWDGPRSR